MEVERSKQGYICPNCGSEYSTMQALSLVDYATGLFKCEFCSAVLEDNTKSELSTQAQQILSKLMDQCAPILNVLKLTDNIILPPHTPFDQVVPPDNLLLEDQRFRYDQRASEDMINSLNEGEDSNRDALEGSGTGSGKDNVIVEFGEDMSLEQAVQKREEKIKLKRKQNALPPWHVWSTVSNSLMVPEYLIPLELNKKAKSENSNNEKSDSNVEIKRIYQYYESLSRAINPKDAPLQSPATVTTGATTEITTASTDDAGDKSGTDGVRLFDSFIVAASPSSSKSSDTSTAEKKTDELNSGENIKPFRLVVTQLVNNMSNGLSLDPKKLLDSNYLLSLSPTQYSVLYSKLYAELKKYLFNATNADGFDSDGFISFLISCYQ
ncbi:Transcription initiation factor IIE subunit alpha [Zancudomyces culisetae]|uniref:Transcription initiation factor IIE subunit alpha n=1 Tax=Zancudomyces culisetae TaxID=1213189 RepID=A0A1R1PNY1_ZANCU|nr:Transcription initiation factor IIE subunit alpha [Zancudomyces culisetae]OMH82679.1 Transcription initiation factor IIE subunit alpha [Zancudomyces culisetae]OMH84534.1 Transcription initiation factor IIE subunit alpha [Zancudomyces culisetae]|eukprot:OMH79384.1 Transcription initiation factor IIE subunit alpha [Zancudomyces culisetae]